MTEEEKKKETKKGKSGGRKKGRDTHRENPSRSRSIRSDAHATSCPSPAHAHLPPPACITPRDSTNIARAPIIVTKEIRGTGDNFVAVAALGAKTKHNARMLMFCSGVHFSSGQGNVQVSVLQRYLNAS